jgi:hypothetical protein
MIGIRNTVRRRRQIALAIGIGIVLGAAGTANASHYGDDCGGWDWWPFLPEPDCVTLSVDLRMEGTTSGPDGDVDETLAELYRGYGGRCGDDTHYANPQDLPPGDLSRSTRIADFVGLTPGPYRLCVTALKDGVTVGERPIELELRESFTVTAVMSRDAPLRATKTATPIDVDGDGAIGFGDLVEYRVDVLNVGDEVFIPVPDRDFTVFELAPDSLELLADTISVSSGSATLASGPGGVLDPHQVVWIYEDLQPGETAWLEVSARFVPAPVSLEAEADVWDRWLDGFNRMTATVAADPGPGVQACLDELADVTDELTHVGIQLADAESIIARDLGDEDADGVLNVADTCPASALADVDALGCTPEQFCAGFPASTGQEKSACNNADWNNDDRDDPQDCRHRGGLCVAR